MTCNIDGCHKPIRNKTLGLCDNHRKLLQRKGTTDGMRIPSEERFSDSYVTEPMSGCWIWLGTITAHGYGEFWGGGIRVKAHRYSYKLHNGGIPDGAHILHKCDTPCCVNPDHLFAGTNLENIADKVAKGRQAAGEAISANQGQGFRTPLRLAHPSCYDAVS